MPTEPDNRFAILHGAQRVWAIGAVHGEVERLQALHETLENRFVEGDRLVYLGNFMGYGSNVVQTQDALLRQRIAFLARPGMDPGYIAYLRGGQEEMWRKLLQLQFAPEPCEVLEWMLVQGVEATLMAYGQNAQDGRAACRGGALSIAKWTTRLRSAMHSHPGHEQLMSVLRRAAYTANGELLFVAAGIDPGRPLGQQGDTLWWGSGYFIEAGQSYAGYKRVVRGIARSLEGIDLDSYAASLDGGCGRGGSLVAACFTVEGVTADWIEV